MDRHHYFGVAAEANRIVQVAGACGITRRSSAVSSHDEDLVHRDTPRLCREDAAQCKVIIVEVDGGHIGALREDVLSFLESQVSTEATCVAHVDEFNVWVLREDLLGTVPLRFREVESANAVDDANLARATDCVSNLLGLEGSNVLVFDAHVGELLVYAFCSQVVSHGDHLNSC